jgi:hypothetical protein
MRRGSMGRVGAHRARPDLDGVALGAQAMSVSAGRRPGDPLAAAVGGRGATIEGRRELEHDVGPPCSSLHDIRPQLLGHGGRLDADRHLDARRPEPPDASTGNQGVRVEDGHDHTPHTGGHDGVGAGAGATMVRARLECAVQGGPASSRAGGRHGHDLRVRTPGRARRTDEQRPVGRHQDRPDPRVG